MGSNGKVDLTVIIVNFNTEKLVCECIGSIPRGIGEYTYKVIVVDNGSVDNSIEEIIKRFPDVTIIENRKNLGFAAANNKGLEIADSSYYLLLNSDTIVCENSIAKVLDFMVATSDCGFASPQLLNEDGTLQNTAANFPSLVTELSNKSLLRMFFPSRYYKKKLVARSPLVVESLVGAALFARAEMCDKIGFYDEGYFFFIEETEWCMRALKNGWKSYLLPHAQIYHLQGQTAKTVPFAVRIEYWRSRYKYFKDSYSSFTYFTLVAGLLIKNTANMLLNLLGAPFSVKSRYKLKLSLYIFKWHLCGCPKNMGLSES